MADFGKGQKRHDFYEVLYYNWDINGQNETLAFLATHLPTVPVDHRHFLDAGMMLCMHRS